MRALALISKFAITFGLLAYLWFKVDAIEALAQLRNSDPLTLVAGTLVLAFLPLLGALRWRLILACLGTPSGLRQVIGWTYVSVFFSQALPATIGGDGLRVWFAHRAGSGIKAAVNSVGLDRVAMLLTLVALLLAVTPALEDLTGFDQLDYLRPVLLVATTAGLAALMLGDRLPGSLRGMRAVRAIGYLAHDARRVFLNPKSAAAVIALCLVSYFTIISSVCLFALAFGANFKYSQFVILLPAVLVASSLPISIGGWGTREMAMVAALGSIEINAHTALLVSLWLGIASILIALPGAILYLANRVSRTAVDVVKLQARP